MGSFRVGEIVIFYGEEHFVKEVHDDHLVLKSLVRHVTRDILANRDSKHLKRSDDETKSRR